ncbi:hypothetical protein B7L17_011625 [Burkholderia cenocepacia]|uniref:hypothetical protein n=1 Tax=Burkholderia cenocepacia TaxID=95486 RepID=UPI002238420A|nr:hypothetical protein [Burkholderia cenocepacia]MCW5118608.1 hypothetical protein [Burkholderia cenocepacia]MCW5130919.1 hypothetical protein [Burkholderia cenocepacia]MCW5174049.1 hypothetical protein [Burkholderia cenocepacia]
MSRRIRCRTVDRAISRSGRVTADKTPAAPAADLPDVNEINRRFWSAHGVHTTPAHDAAPVDDINERHRRFWAPRTTS